MAAAFHAAQNGVFPTHSDRSYPSSRKAPSKSPVPPLVREKSPAEQLAASARALSPVRFFLRQTDETEDYTSFSSLGSANKSAEASYDYQQEEEFVRQAEQNNLNGSTVSGKRGPKKRGRDEDMPYRPAEDDWEANSEDSGEGEGIVRGGALEGRADSRGVRKDKGEGYLGMGLGLRPRYRSLRPNGKEDEQDDGYSHREMTPVLSDRIDVVSPGTRSRYTRSPTPAQVIARAFSPRVEQRPTSSRKRQPSSSRIIITNLLHGIALALRFAVEAAYALVHTLFVRPFGSSKQFLWSLKENWWKWLLGLLLLSLSLRLPEAMSSRGGFIVPDVPLGSMEELVGRLAHLEHAVGLLSDSSNLLAEAEREGRKVDDEINKRVAELEKTFAAQRGRLEEQDGVDRLRPFDSLKNELTELTSRVSSSEKQYREVYDKLARVEKIDTDVRSLRTRVDQVEQNLNSALEDGRLRDALERILPHYMPVKRTPNGFEIEPGFWTELRKVLVGKSEVDAVVRSALTGATSLPKSDKDLEAWGDRFLEQRRTDGVFMTRSEFTEMLEFKVKELKDLITTLPRHQQPAKSSPVIKSPRGDDVTPLFQDLIDAALLRYSKDTIARPDFALFTAGARVIPSITSDTLVMRVPGVFGKYVLGRKPIEGRTPATALHPDISVGSCWPFAGSHGQLGVLLNRRVVISDITIEHAAAEVALDTSTAPRSVEVVSR